MNVIFGSGIIGLLARKILGSSWKVIPFYRSRFFSFNPALDDNFVIHDKQIEPFITDLYGHPLPVFMYKRGWSIGGHIVPEYDASLCGDWLTKIFGQEVPPQSEVYHNKRMSLFVYDLRVNELYQSLVNEYLEDLKTESALGEITQIGQHHFVRNGNRVDFDNAVSTIPLDALCRLMNVQVKLPSKTIHYLHIETEDLNFEGYNQLWVVDKAFSFYKATNVAKNRFLIYCHEEIPNPGIYFMGFIPKFDIIDGTSIENALPMGPSPKLDNLEQAGIYCVGSYAQWDWCMDVGSCMMRLLRYAQREFKPAKMKIIKP
jgi:hypothetical protein